MPSELAYALLGLAQAVALISAAVFFIRWFYLAHRNLGSISVRPATYDSRWAIWGFFIPILNLLRPQQVMREVWTTTSEKWLEEPSQVVGLTHPSDFVNLWWGFFVATSILGNWASRAELRAVTAQETLWATWGSAFANGFDIAAVFAALALIHGATELQRPLLRHVVAAPAA
ncbi:MAG: DUF4328 domain-containing protein [Candidatus Limnocylindria bacterium]